MLKERRNQGTIALLVITFIFLAVAAVMGFIQYQKVNTKTAYDRNSNPGADSAVYAEVSYIFPEALIEVEDNTQVWLVAYQDGYVGLQAKKGDKQIAQLLEKEKRASWKKILSESLAPTLMLTPLRKIRDISLIMAASFAVS